VHKGDSMTFFLLFLCILSPLLLVSKEPDNENLTKETEKLICLIHLFNKKVHKIAHTSYHFKEEFEKHHGTLQSLINDLLKLKDALAIPQHPLGNTTKQVVSSFGFLKKITSLHLSSVGYMAASLVHELADAIERFNSIEEYTRQSSFYVRLAFPIQQGAALNNTKEHLTTLHTYLKAISQDGSTFLYAKTEEEFVKTILTASPTLSQFTERATLTLGALHNLVITQLEQVYTLQRTITLFEKEPTSIIDDTHEKKVTLSEKLLLSEKYFTDTFQALTAVISNSIHIINNSFAFLQTSNTILQVPFPKEQEIETQVLDILDCLAELNSSAILPSS
jgi:hypothetical protein